MDDSTSSSNSNTQHQTKYILVTGGVISGIGKGTVTSAIGSLLQACGHVVTAIKIDPYLNIDAGIFSPYEHGEVYVLDDGGEVDLDLGNYERALDVRFSKRNNITKGKINRMIIIRERRGDYLGKTVQIVPHETDAIKYWIRKVGNSSRGLPKKPDICLIELGGTVGDIETMPFLEALKQFRVEIGSQNIFCVHVSLCISLRSGEIKTKALQDSVTKLRTTGFDPNLIVCRCQIPIGEDIRRKIAFACSIERSRVVELPDLKTNYYVPIKLKQEKVLKAVSECLRIECHCDDEKVEKWANLTKIVLRTTDTVIIGLVGKYTALKDCYASVMKAIEHACFEVERKPEIRFINSEFLEEGSEEIKREKAWQDLKSSDCLLVPGGFGSRGTEGKINSIEYARKNKMPFLGICLGFQMAVVEYAKNVLGDEKACSGEFAGTLETGGRKLNHYIIEMPEHLGSEKGMGGTMRLGLRTTIFDHRKSALKSLYKTDLIKERHRHRYEVNPDYIEQLESAGLKFVGKSDDLTRMEVLELDESIHPFFVGVQYHPEYLSRPSKPSHPFRGLIQSSLRLKGILK